MLGVNIRDERSNLNALLDRVETGYELLKISIELEKS